MTSPATKQTGFKAIAIARSDIFAVTYDKLRLKPGFNERRDLGDIDSLAESILHNGFIKYKPLIVEWNREESILDIIAGERRFRALTLIIDQGKDPGPIWCVSQTKDTTPEEQLYEMLIENTGKPFTLLEKGRAYLRILAANPETNASAIADRVMESKQAVSQALAIVRKGTPAMLAAIEANKISGTTAHTVIKEAADDAELQDKLLDEAIAAAAQAGSATVTPKHVKKTPKPEKIKPDWNISETEHHWDEGKVCTTPTRITATGARWNIKLIEITYALRDGLYYGAFNFDLKKEFTGSLPNACFCTGHPTADDAVLAEWQDLHPLLTEYALSHKDQTKILAYLDDLGTALHAIFSASKTAEPAASASENTSSGAGVASDDAYFADLADDESEDDTTTITSDAPADPGAMDRIKAADSNSGGGGGTFGSLDKKREARIHKINDMMDELNKDNCNTDRWDTIELILDYLDGSHTVAKIKAHLQS